MLRAGASATGRSITPTLCPHIHRRSVPMPTRGLWAPAKRRRTLSRVNGEQMPSYHRLDLRLDRQFALEACTGVSRRIRTCSQALVGQIVLLLNDLAGFKVSLNP